MEFGEKSLGRDAFIGYQKQKERLARPEVGGIDEKAVRDLLPSRSAS
jgi:hypothetical protein